MFTAGNVQITRLGISLDNIKVQFGNAVYAFVKRAMDIILPLAALVVLSPLMALIAAGIKMTSPGPVFYKQKRCTKGGREFWLYKFRSMPHQIEKDNKPVWGARDDSRSTCFGKILRITGLDELPQLINIISGDMSLVGPRPERPFFIEKFRKTIDNYGDRLRVKAGLTGWAQVNGYRGTTSVVKRVEYDLFYIDNRSILMDILIILRTPFSIAFKMVKGDKE